MKGIYLCNHENKDGKSGFVIRLFDAIVLADGLFVMWSQRRIG